MSRPLAVALATILLAGACATSASPSPAGPTGVANACFQGGAPVATTYPGWPGTGTGDVLPLLVSQELTVGPNRFLFTLIDPQNRLVAAPEVGVDLRFFQLAQDPSTPAAETSASYLEAEEGRGLYVAEAAFDCSGDWGAELVARVPGREDRQVRVQFQVLSESSTPGIGEMVPEVDTPTADSIDEIAAISTDTAPDPDFYTTSVAEALVGDRPFALIFATPAFCQTRACGPTLDIVKSVARPYKERMTFIHVEPYRLKMTDSGLQPELGPQGGLQTVESVTSFGLRSEPYIFVMDGAGLVTAKFEGLAGEDELRRAFDAVVSA